MATPLPIIDNSFRVAHQYHSNDATFVNVYWMLDDSGTATPEDVANSFFSAYKHVKSSFGMVTIHSQDATFDGCTVTPLDGTSPSVFTPYPTTTHGGTLSAATAANAALTITWESDQRGRAHRGRSYLGCMPNAGLESGGARWSSASIADYNDAVTSFFEGLGVATPSLEQLIVSQRAAAGPSHRLVGAGVPRARVGSQRRRTERGAP